MTAVSCRSDLGRGRSEPERLHTGGPGRGGSRGRAPCCGRSPGAAHRSRLCGASPEKTEEEETLVSLVSRKES